MPALAESNFLQALGWAILNSFWQMAFLWVLYKGLLSLRNKTWTASSKANLAGFFTVAGFSWFVITLIRAMVQFPESNWVTETTLFLHAKTSLWYSVYALLPYASFLYLLLLVIPVRQFIRNLRYVHIIRNNGLEKIDIRWRLFVQNLSARIGLHKKVRIWLSDFVNSPVTVGYLKPVILIPAAAINNLSVDQMEAVLLHELAHIRRNDYLVNMLLTIIKTVLYFNPFVRYFINQVEEEREATCDEMVMQFQYDPQHYATALYLLEKNAATSLAMAASGQHDHLAKRIEKLLGVYKPRLSFRKITGTCIGLLTILLMNAFYIQDKAIAKNQERQNTATPPGNSGYYYPASFGTPSYSRTPENNSNYRSSFKNNIATNNEIQPGQSVSELPEEPGNNMYPEEPLPVTGGPYLQVNDLVSIMPQLSKKEEAQIAATVEAAKRIISEKQWNEVQKGFADALNSLEKEKVKLLYEKEVKAQDWDKLKDKLTISYENLDWQGINNQLNAELAQIKADSITRVYEMALTELSNYEKKMEQEKLTSIPDTYVTLAEIQKQQKQIQADIKKIQSAKPKKIIRL